MDSQDPEDLEFPFSQSADDPVILSQPRRRTWDEPESSERRVQPRSDPSYGQPSLRNLPLNARTLVIVLEAETMLSGEHQVIFEGSFENNDEGQMVSRLSNEFGHRFWLQGPLNHLTRERRIAFITSVLHQILKFLRV